MLRSVVRPTLLAALALFTGLSLTAHAQLGLYANFGAAKVNSQSDWIYGPTFGGYLDKGHFGFFSAGVDARGVILGANSTTTFDAGYIGPRVAVRPHVLPIKPYVEALAGIGYASTYGQSDTRFSYQFNGGVDFTVLPRIDWRIVEFSYGGLSFLGSSFNPKTISTGIVVRLPNVF